MYGASDLDEVTSARVRALLDLHAAAKTPEFVNGTAKPGVFAYFVDHDAAELQAALDIVRVRRRG